MSADFSIRPVTEGDFADFCRLFAEVHLLHARQMPNFFRVTDEQIPERGYFDALLADATAGLYLAEMQGKAVGMLILLFRQASASVLVPRTYVSVDTVVVNAEARGQGIGRGLMQFAESWAADHGAASVELNVYDFNHPAFHLYQELGYEVISHKMRKEI
jgi:GNAT superfamily N-acetyltransferase